MDSARRWRWAGGNWARDRTMDAQVSWYDGGSPSLSASDKGGDCGDRREEEAREEVLAFLTFFFFGTTISSSLPVSSSSLESSTTSFWVFPFLSLPVVFVNVVTVVRPVQLGALCLGCLQR